jgi:hypothetical protein
MMTARIFFFGLSINPHKQDKDIPASNRSQEPEIRTAGAPAARLSVRTAELTFQKIVHKIQARERGNAIRVLPV